MILDYWRLKIGFIWGSKIYNRGLPMFWRMAWENWKFGKCENHHGYLPIFIFRFCFPNVNLVSPEILELFEDFSKTSNYDSINFINLFYFTPRV